jgi:Holliday junction resolvase RusA-like endonuclease
MQWDYEATFLGEPASKANSRRIVKIKGSPRIIKSQKALSFARSFVSQCPTQPVLLDANGSRLLVVMDIYYASRRPDLDESLLLDLLQHRVYENDRSVKAKIVRWHLDRESPRTKVKILCLPAGYGEQS